MKNADTTRAVSQEARVLTLTVIDKREWLTVDRIGGDTSCVPTLEDTRHVVETALPNFSERNRFNPCWDFDRGRFSCLIGGGT